MQIENPTFYGRQKEIDLLFQSWLEARAGKPQWVSVVAETGTGKTRLVHEFYRYISDVAYRHSKASAHSSTVGWHENFDTSNYWPDQLPLASNMLGLNPHPDGLTDAKIESLKDIPWLWWGMRGDPQRRNGPENGCAASVALCRLELHAALLALQKGRLEANLAAVVEIGKYAIPKIPVVGPLFELVIMAGELIWAGKRPFETLLRGYGIHVKQERKKQQVKLQDMLVDLIMQFLKRDVPVVLILDDIHFFDADSHDFLKKLSERVADQTCKLMIISTSWAEEWCDGANCPAHELFKGKKEPLALGTTEREHVRQFLLSHFPGLNADDQKLLADKANGNFGYATELVLALKAEAEDFFEGMSVANGLSADGRGRVGSLSLEMDKLVQERFRKLEKSVRTALMRSSYQGVRFDPGLTARVTGAVDHDDPGASATLTAIERAEKPGAMVCSVDADMREFLQGPYWRLIRERLERSNDRAAIEAAYRQLVTAGDAALDDGIVESLVGQWLTPAGDPVQQLHWRACLLELAVGGRRYHAGLHQLSAMADLMLALGKRADVDRKGLLSPRSALAALRIFNQYVFGGGNQNKREQLETFCRMLAEQILQGPIRDFLHSGELPQGCDLPELITWCEALVGFRQSLGHMHDTVQWLAKLADLQKAQLEMEPAVAHAHFPYAATLLRLAETQAMYTKDRAGWDEVFDYYRRVAAQADTLRGAHRSIVWGWGQISALRFTVAGRACYPNQAWGDDVRSFGTAAAKLSEVLDEIEPTGIPTQWDDDLLEALLHAAGLTVEHAISSGLGLATAFVDRLRPVSLAVLARVQEGAYVPIALVCAAMNAEIAASGLLYGRAGTSDGDNGREVDSSEALAVLDHLITALDRYRQLGMLSTEMISIAARVRHDRLLLTSPVVGEAQAAFESMLDDAALIKDGERAGYGEPPQVLEWLVRIFDRWLADTSEADRLWERLRAVYRRAGAVKFDGLVAKFTRNGCAKP